MFPQMVACMDESIDGGRRVFVIAGFVGRIDAWNSLTAEWIDRIQPQKLPNPISAFHMTDCETGHGEFRDRFGWDRDSRRQLITDLIEIICKHQVVMWGIGVRIEDYEALAPVNEEGVKLGRSSYHFVLQAAIAYLAGEMEGLGNSHYDTIDFLFDRRDDHETWARTLHKELRNSEHSWGRYIGTLSFSNKTEMRRLQVADLGAYETMKHLTNALYNEGRTRRSFEKLADNRHVLAVGHLPKEKLDMIHEHKVTTLRQLYEKRATVPKEISGG
jgi:hypothetical protein